MTKYDLITLSQPCLFALYNEKTKEAMVWYSLCPLEVLYRIFNHKHRYSKYVLENLDDFEIEITPCPKEDSHRRLIELKSDYRFKGYKVINKVRKYGADKQVTIEVREIPKVGAGYYATAILKTKTKKRVIGVFNNVLECEEWIKSNYPEGWKKEVVAKNDLTVLYLKR